MFDILIKQGVVFDGTNNPPVKADIGIKGDLIIAVGDLYDSDAVDVINASGLSVAPGFIDAHTHDDASLIIRPDMEAKLSQGVTTVICGNCGISGAPYDLTCEPPGLLRLVFKSEDFVAKDFESYVAKVEEAKPSVNSAFFTGHTTLRMNAMGKNLNRAATKKEIDVMKEELELALCQGSIGLSTGLFYEPANAAPTAEVVELAKVLESYGGIYATHMRDEADFVVESVEEAIKIGSEARVPIIISHHKCQGQHNHGKSVVTLKAMAKARKTQSIALDVYPYAASSTVLNEVSVLRAQKTIVTWSDPYPEVSGRDLESIAAEFGVSKLDAMQKLLPGGAIYFMMDESDIERIMTSSNAMIGSDGLPEDSHPHPRLWGTFPRVLGHYARDRQVMPMHDAVNRMTGLSAKNFHLAGRGMLKPGFFADVTIFNHDTIIDLATFERPKQKSLGVEQVIVNGKTAWIDGKCVGAGQGKVLKRRVGEK